ncbi:MAG: hypothetical protein WED05_00945 [Candidatus Atabeyarchaeum deiterrae]
MSALISGLGMLFIFFGIIMVIWLVMQVEYTVKFSLFKTSATVTIMSLLLGFGIQFILVSSYF